MTATQLYAQSLLATSLFKTSLISTLNFTRTYILATDDFHYIAIRKYFNRNDGNKYYKYWTPL